MKNSHQILRVDVLEISVIIGICCQSGPRLISHRWVFEKMIHRIDPKAIGALIQPEPQNVLHGVDNALLLVVEVGLFSRELMQIILLPFLVPRPRSDVENRYPIVGHHRPSVQDWIAIVPHVKVLEAFNSCDGLQEPFVLVTKRIFSNRL